MSSRAEKTAAAVLAAALSVAMTLGLAAGPGAAAPVKRPFKLPAVGHVFTIVLENKSYDNTFGPTPGSEYLARTLPAKGQLLTQYYGTGHNSLGNYITMISGQSENPSTQADCNTFSEFTPGTKGSYGQAVGDGCVYPAAFQTVADQLEKKQLTWRGYMEDMGANPVRDNGTTCAHPAIGSPDPTQAASPDDQYATRHDPFVYFHSIIDDAAGCSKHVVNLSALPHDLAKKPKKVPNFSFITPDLCSDGHDGNCINPAQQGGYPGIDGFLRAWVPKILKSKAYKQDGLLIVTFDESEGGSPESCCFVPSGPNVQQQGGSGPGGGRVGAVLLSPFIKKGTVNDHPYNHYDYLRTIEDLFKLGHLGYAAAPGVKHFGKDVFGR